MSKIKFDATRGGYGIRDYFNAGLDKRTGICDEEGVEFYDEESGQYIGNVVGVSSYEVEEMDELEFARLLDDNYLA